MQQRAGAGVALRQDRVQKSVGAPPSAFRRATKAVKRLEALGLKRRGDEIAQPFGDDALGGVEAVGEPASRQLS